MSKEIRVKPSTSTCLAINRISSGKFLCETIPQRLSDIYRHTKNDNVRVLLNEAIKHGERIRRAERRVGIPASKGINTRAFLLDKDYKKHEQRVLSVLTPDEVYNYANNLYCLVNNCKVDPRANNKPIKNFTSNHIDVNFQGPFYGKWSFCLRADNNFKRRIGKNPETVSKAIICLYTPEPEAAKIMLYNIGSFNYAFYETGVQNFICSLDLVGFYTGWGWD